MKRRACGVVEVPKPPCTHARRFFIVISGLLRWRRFPRRSKPLLNSNP